MRACVVVSCDSEEDNVEMTYVVVLSESQCIARPLGTDVTVNILRYFP